MSSTEEQRAVLGSFSVTCLFPLFGVAVVVPRPFPTRRRCADGSGESGVSFLSIPSLLGVQ